jgi:hypothetical protein
MQAVQLVVQSSMNMAQRGPNCPQLIVQFSEKGPMVAVGFVCATASRPQWAQKTHRCGVMVPVGV